MSLIEFLKEYGYIISVVVVPVGLWFGSIWYQNRRLRQEAKIDLFLTLMSHRRTFPITQDWVDALNTIDVVFQDSLKVRSAWKAYYESLHEGDPKNVNSQTYQIELLSAIAKDLGYNDLKPSEIADFYSPAQFGDTLQTQSKIQTELLRVLGNSHSYAESRKSPTEQLLPK